MSEHQLVGIADHGPVRVITMNRPEARNALSLALQTQLAEAIRTADDHQGVACTVLTGADPAFCAGLDLKELGQGIAPSTLSGETSCFTAINRRRTPMIGAINGSCATGGLEIALACDFLIASERARFADTHAKVGFTPAAGMSVLLPQAVGARMAREMSLTGRFLDAAEAFRVGLVNRVVDHDELLPTAISIGHAIAAGDQDAVRAIKDLYDRGAKLNAGEALDLELEVFRNRRVTAETIEARRDAVIEGGRS